MLIITVAAARWAEDTLASEPHGRRGRKFAAPDYESVAPDYESNTDEPEPDAAPAPEPQDEPVADAESQDEPIAVADDEESQ